MNVDFSDALKGCLDDCFRALVADLATPESKDVCEQKFLKSCEVCRQAADIAARAKDSLQKDAGATVLANNGGSIAAAATAFNVASSAGFPNVPFVAFIDAERVNVTAVKALAWTAVRGFDGTAAAPHNDGAKVTSAAVRT
jgi:hypothetical protein